MGLPIWAVNHNQCDQKKLPNVYKSWPKMIDFDTFTKLPKNMGDLGKLIVLLVLRFCIQAEAFNY